MKYPLHLLKLIAVFKKLPGVGSKTAERYAFQLMTWPQKQLEDIIHLIEEMPAQLQNCRQCGCLMDQGCCHFCQDQSRDQSQLCIIASPREAFAISGTCQYRGLFHVLGSMLSPFEGKGLDPRALEKLKQRVKDSSICEVIIALDSTLEGDATAHFLKQELASFSVTTSRLAFGLPMGSSLEFIDGSTLAQALSGRRSF